MGTMFKVGNKNFIKYGITFQSMGNDDDSSSMIEFFVDHKVTADCVYPADIDIEADGFLDQPGRRRDGYRGYGRAQKAVRLQVLRRLCHVGVGAVELHAGPHLLDPGSVGPC